MANGSNREAGMRRLIAALFFVPAAINLLPFMGVLGADRLEALYGLPFADADLLLLMRHRAVLIGLVGALLLAAAFRRSLRPVAALAGLVSMGSYLLLALPPGQHNALLQRVFWADVVAMALLLLAFGLSRRQVPRP